MTWSDVAVAGAFVLGTVVGGFAVIRVTRYVLESLRHQTGADDDPRKMRD